MEIEVVLIANAGLMLKVGQTKILIDSLYEGKDTTFSSPSQSTMQKIRKGLPPFEDISYVFLTHFHPDHFEPGLFLNYIKSHKLKGIYLPGEAVNKYPDFFLEPILGKSNVHILPPMPGETQSFDMEDSIRFCCFKSSHIRQDIFKDIANYSYLFFFHNKTLLVPGDADTDLSFFTKMLKGIKLDAFFANPLFINKPEGRQILQELAPNLVVFYHIPFAEDDSIFFRQIVRQGCRKYADILPKVVVLQDEMQGFSI